MDKFMDIEYEATFLDINKKDSRNKLKFDKKN